MLRSTWLAEGRVEVPPETVEAGLWEEIAEEAERCEPHAVLSHNQRPGLLAMRDGSITSPQRCRVHPGGKALNALATVETWAPCKSSTVARQTADM